MTFGESIKTCFSKFVTWRGRASRSEYWYFILFGLLAYLAAVAIDNVLGTTFKIPDPLTGVEQNMGYGYAYVLVGLVLLLPSLSVLVRRLHDTDRSGWYYWIALIPLVGVIVLIVWLCSRGTNGDNKYGADPLGGDFAEVFS